jgi:hypothetical protein
LITQFINADKVGGYVRGLVAAGLAALIAKYPPLAGILDPATETALEVAAAGIAVGIWSHVAKRIASGQSAVSTAVTKQLILLAILAPAALGLSACNFQTLQASFQADVSQVEAQIAAFIAKVKQNAPIVLADAEQAVSLSCSIVPGVQQNLASFTTSISNPSPKVQAALTQANDAAVAAAAACATYNAQLDSSQPPTLAQAVNFGLAIWNSYQSAKTALQNATTIVAAGS